MQWLQNIGKWLAAQIIEELKRPVEELQKEVKAQNVRIDKLQATVDAQNESLNHLKEGFTEQQKCLSKIEASVKTLEENDQAQIAFEKASGKNSICYFINRALKRGYVTEDEMECVPELIDAYRGIKGNGRAEYAYSKFVELPTRAEYERILTTRAVNTQED